MHIACQHNKNIKDFKFTIKSLYSLRISPHSFQASNQITIPELPESVCQDIWKLHAFLTVLLYFIFSLISHFPVQWTSVIQFSNCSVCSLPSLEKVNFRFYRNLEISGTASIGKGSYLCVFSCIQFQESGQEFHQYDYGQVLIGFYFVT